MACFSVYLKPASKQLWVFFYDAFLPNDRDRAWKLALSLANEQHSSGCPCTVEEFTFSPDVGYLVYDTDKGLAP